MEKEIEEESGSWELEVRYIGYLLVNVKIEEPTDF